MARAFNAMYGGYGAFELKSKYQRNMLAGTLCAALLVVVAVGAFYLYKALTAEDSIYFQPTVIKTVADLGPPPTVSKKPPRIEIAPSNMAAPKVGIPKPVADDEAIDNDVMIASRDELAAIVPPSVIDTGANNQSNVVVDIPSDEYMPAPDEFVPVEIPAEMISEAVPEYPKPAKMAGMEGEVWVKVLVDKNGEVKKAMIYKSSGSKAGFDEAALAAAYKCKFKPAVQNGRPVPVWVAWRFAFSLTDSR
jgi:protein TonB